MSPGERTDAASPAARRERLRRSLQQLSRRATHPLSVGQRALWFLHRLAPDSAAYNLYLAARVRGQADRRILAAALERLAHRHAALRTVFGEREGVPFQRILAEVRFEIDEQDARGEDADALNARIRREVRRPFELEADPPLRAALLRNSDVGDVLVLTAHHLIGDFWSLVVLLRDLGACYEEARDGVSVPPPPKTVDYIDFLRWQQEMLAAPRGAELEAYWRAELSGELPTLDLPPGRPRPPQQTFDGATHGVVVPRALLEPLKALARAEGTTLYVVLLAAYVALLHRYTGQRDVLVGSPVAGRSRPDFEGVCGFFVNMVVLRGRPRQGQSFAELVRELKRTTLAALEHQDYPFPLLVEALNPRRDASRPPLLQATFVLQRSQDAGVPVLSPTRGGQRIRLGPLELESLSLDSEATQFDLTLFAQETEEGLLAELTYNVTLFEPAFIERMGRHLTRLLEHLGRSPEREHALAPLVSEDERSERAAVCGPDEPEPWLPVHRSFERQAAATPDRRALEWDTGELTFAELDARVRRLAAGLAARGVSRGDVVGLHLARSPEQLVAVLAVLRAGAAYTPLDPAYPAERIALAVEDSAPKLVLTDAAARDGLNVPAASVAQVEREGRDGAPAPPGVGPDDLAYVLFTSGSTGRPKGVMVPHRALANHMRWMQDELPLAADDRVLQRTSFAFDASVWELFGPPLAGATLVLAPTRAATDLGELRRALAERAITVVQMVPSLLDALLEASALAGCEALRRVFCGGEALSPQLAARFFAHSDARLINLYGPTEACVDSTWHEVTENDVDTVPIGRPIHGAACHVVDANGMPVPDGIPGELWLGGRGLALGYRNRPAETGTRFVPDPWNGRGTRLYRTGDRVRWNDQGQLEYLGRVDRQLKINGVRIEAGEIEHALASHPDVRTCAVARDGEDGTLAAYVVPHGAAAPEATALTEWMERRLPPPVVPRRVVLLDELPLSPNGKVDLDALPRAGGAPRAPRTPPRNDLERRLARIFEQVLGVADVSVHDNYYELGGESLRGLRLAALCEAEAIPVTIDDLPRHPTVAELARAAAKRSDGERAKAEDEGWPLVPLKPGGTRAPLFLVHPMEGTVDGLALLAGRLGADRSVIGVEALALRAEGFVARSLEELADRYLEAIRRAHPGGPIHLAGWSMGARMVAAMAAALERDGEAPGFVGLIDPGPLDFDVGHYRAPGLPDLTGLAEDVLADGEEQAIDALLATPAAAAWLAGYPDARRARRLARALLRHAALLRPYRPQPLRAAFTVFVAEGEPANQGTQGSAEWARLSEHSSVERLPGSHFDLVQPPYVGALARRLLAALHGRP
ncbi:MAG: amino acid adenylation domain-containing protein [Planctomycetota bacterium]